MRSPDPTLPSIAFVLSRAQPVSTSRSSSTRRRGKFGVRRSKSSPSLAPGPHPPRYPPQLDSEFLETVDYRFSDLPLRAPSRSSFALPKDIFDTDAEIEIVVPSPTESEPASTAGSSCSTASSSRSTRTRRQRTGVVTAYMQSVASRRELSAMNTPGFGERDKRLVLPLRRSRERVEETSPK